MKKKKLTKYIKELNNRELKSISDVNQWTREIKKIQKLLFNKPTKKEYRRKAEALWQLLDDIDSLSDAIKPSTLEEYKEFYKRAIQKTKHRFEYFESDGYNLKNPEL